jgi:hypothetical protein
MGRAKGKGITAGIWSYTTTKQREGDSRMATENPSPSVVRLVMAQTISDTLSSQVFVVGIAVLAEGLCRREL